MKAELMAFAVPETCMLFEEQSWEVIVIVVRLLSSGCSVQAIVLAFGLDERTAASWRNRAGAHCEQVHQAVVEAAKLDLVQGSR